MEEDTFHLGVKALIQNKKGQILLLKVNIKELKETKKTYWDIPGGRIQRGDSVVVTLKRELKEETGIRKIIKITPFSMVLSNIRIPLKKGDVGLVLAAYICRVDDVDKIKISKEHVEYGWFYPREAAELLQVKYPIEFTQSINNLG